MAKSISQQLAEKTFKELGINPRTGKLLTPPNSSYAKGASSAYQSLKHPFRIKALEKTKRQSPKGLAYQYSVLYRNAVILRLLIKKFTSGLNPKKYHRLIDQMDSSARSVVANIREGYLRPSSVEYSIFLGYSQGSLEEIRGDIIDAKDDRLLASHPGTTLAGIGILLRSPNFSYHSPKSSYAQSASTAYDPLGEYKRKIREVKRDHLTYEIFLELVNKTDYLLKRAVAGIDKKIISDEEKKLENIINNEMRKHW